MYLDYLLKGYKLGRFIFSLSFLFSYFVYLNISKNDIFNFSIVILIIYSFLSFILLFHKGVSILEFILDIAFLSGFMFFNFSSAYYMSILYLFPIIFYGILTGSKKVYILAFISSITYTIVRYLVSLKFTDTFIPSLLHTFSFFAISFASLKLNKEIKEKEEEEKLLEEEKKQKLFYKKLYEIAANIAHEIKNPLASISGGAQLLKEGKVNDKVIDIIYRESKRVDELLKDFLSLSNTYNTYTRQLEEINILNLVEETVEPYRLKKEISVNVKPVKIISNKKALKSIIENIIKNAVFWAKSKVLVSSDIKKNKLFIVIEDDGKGIDKKLYNKIFDPFFTTRHEGTGLGLSIAKNLAMNLGGDIYVIKSENLGGAKFIIEVPINNESSNSR